MVTPLSTSRMRSVFGEDSLTFENKLLVQKDVGNWILLYNLVAETESIAMGRVAWPAT